MPLLLIRQAVSPIKYQFKYTIHNIQIVSFSKFFKIIVDFFPIFLLGILGMKQAAANGNLTITPDN